MNAKELATLLGVHPNTIYNMIRSGEIKAEKNGRSFYIPNEEIERLTQKKPTTPVEEVVKQLEFVEIYFKRDLAEIEEVLQETSRRSMNGETFDISGKDIFDLMDEKGMHEKILLQLAFIKRYVQLRTKLFQKQDANGGITTYSREVKDHKKD